MKEVLSGIVVQGDSVLLGPGFFLLLYCFDIAGISKERRNIINHQRMQNVFVVVGSKTHGTLGVGHRREEATTSKRLTIKQGRGRTSYTYLETALQESQVPTRGIPIPQLLLVEGISICYNGVWDGQKKAEMAGSLRHLKITLDCFFETK
eukprot:scaffold2043_cov166-Amphora_coffeaeformis.AAC.29